MSKHQLVTFVFALFFLAFSYFYFTADWSLWIGICAALLWLTIVVIGSFNIRLNYHLISKTKLESNSQIVAITFDDGPTPFTNQALDLLKKHQAKATFFCIGKQIEMYPDIFLRILNEGHSVGNHTFTHDKNMGFKSTAEVMKEIVETNIVIKKISGQSTKLFRPPFGVTNPNISKAIKKTQMESVAWSIRSLDTVINNDEQIVKRIESQLKANSIILLHDTTQKSINALALLLTLLDQRALKSVALKQT